MCLSGTVFPLGKSKSCCTQRVNCLQEVSPAVCGCLKCYWIGLWGTLFSWNRNKPFCTKRQMCAVCTLLCILPTTVLCFRSFLTLMSKQKEMCCMHFIVYFTDHCSLFQVIFNSEVQTKRDVLYALYCVFDQPLFSVSGPF